MNYLNCSLCNKLVKDKSGHHYYILLNSRKELTVVCPDCEKFLGHCLDCGQYFDPKFDKNRFCCRSNKETKEAFGTSVIKSTGHIKSL